MTEQEVRQALEDRFKGVETNVTDATTKIGLVEQSITEAKDTLKSIGEKVEDLLSKNKTNVLESVDEQLTKFLTENKDKLKSIKDAGAGVLTFTPKSITTASGTQPNGTPVNVGYSMPDVKIETRDFLLKLVSRTRTNKAAFPYTELIPTGDAGVVAEGGLKPEIGFTWTTRWSEPKKVAAYEILSDEVITDIPQMTSLANEVLKRKHDLKRNETILGYVISQATAFAGLDLSGTIENPYFLDVINAVALDIYLTKNYTGDTNEFPNVALVNPVDFFTKFTTSKNGNGEYLYPTAVFSNYVNVGGMYIMPSDAISLGNVLVADMKGVNFVDYVDYFVKIGWINEQLIHNMFTMVGESRFHLFIKNQDKKRFKYDAYQDVFDAIKTA